VHGRTRHQKSTEPVNFEGIKLVKESINVPVIANGSIFSTKDADEMYEKTGVDGVMSARGLLQNPALFAGYETTPWECIEVRWITLKKRFEIIKLNEYIGIRTTCIGLWNKFFYFSSSFNVHV
jgi:tRNA-dihydrouridine synthase